MLGFMHMTNHHSDPCFEAEWTEWVLGKLLFVDNCTVCLARYGTGTFTMLQFHIKVWKVKYKYFIWPKIRCSTFFLIFVWLTLTFKAKKKVPVPVENRLWSRRKIIILPFFFFFFLIFKILTKTLIDESLGKHLALIEQFRRLVILTDGVIRMDSSNAKIEVKSLKDWPSLQ